MSERTTCEIRTPFGGAVSVSDLECTLRPHLNLPGSSERTSGGLTWTHILEVPGDTDIRDGLTRFAGANSFTYADGDEVRIPNNVGTIYVVVYVERVPGIPGIAEVKRAYLMRDTAVWPGP